MIKGNVFNIQRFSIHDGPGIRTIVFFKGCPLKCQWCQNPEGISRNIDLLCYQNKCLDCRTCIKECSENAITFSSTGPVIDRNRCSLCLRCVVACPTEAIMAAGRETTVAELVKEVLKDRLIFEESGGGVTISGGEPLMQAEFLINLLKALTTENMHTVIETSGYAPWAVLKRVAEWTSLFLYDLKVIDPEMSFRHTGVSSVLMLNNLKKLINNGSNVQVRMPLIPSVNDSISSLLMVASYLKDCGIEELELMPYHNFGSAKYSKLDLEYRMNKIKTPTPDHIKKITSFLEQKGLNIKCEAG